MKRFLGAAALGLFALTSSHPVHAATLEVFDLGTVNPAKHDALLGKGVKLSAVDDAPIVSGGGVNSGTIIGSNDHNKVGNSKTYTDGTVGWDPFGTNSSNRWLSIGGSSGDAFNGAATASATFTFTKPETKLTFVWGSPSSSNTVSLYAANGSLIGTVSANGNSQLFIDGASAAAITNANLANTSNPGAIVEIMSKVAFTKAVFSTANGQGGFEVGGVSAVPLPAALPLFASAIGGLGFLGVRRKRRT